MWYWDNAATTWPKPVCVIRAMENAVQRLGANPGRGGHTMSLAAAEEVYRCRETAARLFHVDDPSHVIFTLNCTMALNMALKGILRNGGRAVVSDFEHNAVMRPLHAMSPKRLIYDVAQVFPGDDDRTVEAFHRCIRPDTRVLVCTHASNVFGISLPIRRLGKLAREHGLLFVVDGAQSAGVLPLDMQEDRIDFLCLAGHKALYGPMGTGLLLCGNRYPLPSLLEGGTGTQSLSVEQPWELPEHLESGTVNLPGICGLRAGMEWVEERGVEAIGRQEIHLLGRVYDWLRADPRIRLYTPRPTWGKTAPVLSFNVTGMPSEEIAARLNQQQVAVRAGLQCCPMAHRHFGTIDTGTVRLSPSWHTTEAETEEVCKIIRQSVGKPLQ